MSSNKKLKHLLWWGRFDPDYSRNRIIRKLLHESGYKITDFRPRISPLGSIEFLLSRLRKPDAVWVPTFRQRDFHPARRYADKQGIPVIFDPLISGWDKAIYERKKFQDTDRRAIKLLKWEQSMFSRADLVIADTTLHAQFFIETLNASPENIHIIPVGAEESLFSKQPYKPAKQTEVLFFGSFIQLQGPEVIVNAARLAPELQWTMLGNGPLLKTCRQLSSDLDNISFEDWLPYGELATRIGKADILLGIFGQSPKAGRVIPNKVYQALACGRPLVTRHSDSYPAILRDNSESGIIFIPPGDPPALAAAVRMIVNSKVTFSQRCNQARLTYEGYFSEKFVKKALHTALASLRL